MYFGKYINQLFLLFCLFNSCNSPASFNHLQKEENKYNLSTIDELEDTSYTDKIEEFYNKGREGRFNGKEQVEIYYKTFTQEKKGSPAIVISSGRTEAAIKYKELIFDLYTNGYSVYILDHRGQGLSGRMTADPDMGYVDNFQYYVDDLKFFYDSLVVPKNHERKYLLCHSMGGAIGMTYLEQNNNDFNAAAFSSPMLGLPFGSCGGAKLLEKDTIAYAPGGGKYAPTPFKENTLTGSAIRLERMNTAFKEVPKARLGGATYEWVLKSCNQFDIINSNIDKIETPFILFSGENEQIVSTKAHEEFISSAKGLGKVCEGHLVENAQHELLIEKDTERTETINKTLDYFEKYR
ncbi:alpha/beta fold hydrolase [Flammeovirga kamogawensis]|uniref:Alpha/beta fold hydrolase n=1 Tax=Flammeovirga kamogawensis TaxID=373891 RepID=A0ABX8H3W4_9BACT|nr:alpha/beta fold hydrolase [Flammeovirga kamogawensis]MBB6463118.1 lysophospholipase [Flammeovirga kamogawensis]QWG10354.1 alpha/beta fold hydrolase [Flammeovirga kamogawensis]TRX63864.1 alpha/beta fold hydrolase [Flammeovirga kamogawensis]